MAIEGVGLPFKEAQEFFARKVNLPTQRSDDLRHGAHVRAFSVAGVTRDDMLADFRAALQSRFAEGTSYEDFRKRFDDIVDRTGWRFKSRGSTEEERRDWRARIIYNTNLRTAYQAGRYAQMMDPDVLAYRPFWMYRHNDVRFPRPMHVKWDGTVLLASNQWWKVHYPPNGFGCQCDVVALSRRDLAKLGKTGPDPTPADDTYPGIDPRTGEPEVRHPGVDRGWEYNVGEASLQGVVPTELQEPLAPYGTPIEPKERPPLPPPRQAKPEDLMPDGLAPERYVEAFLKPFGATLDQGAYYRDASGGIIGIDRSLFEARDAAGAAPVLKVMKRDRERYMMLLADALKDPDEIWVDWAAVKSGVVLRRAYIKRVVLPDGRALFLRFEWTRAGWSGVTAFDTTDAYLQKQRSGVLLYRRP